jgi:hypothetical protein
VFAEIKRVDILGNKSDKNIYRIKSDDFEKIEDVYVCLKRGFDKYIYNFVVEYKSEDEMKFYCEKDTSFYRKGIELYSKINCQIKNIGDEFEVKFDVKRDYTVAYVIVLLLSLLILAILLLRETAMEDIIFISRAFGILDVIFICLLSVQNSNKHVIMKKFIENIKNTSYSKTLT